MKKQKPLDAINGKTGMNKALSLALIKKIVEATGQFCFLREERFNGIRFNHYRMPELYIILTKNSSLQEIMQIIYANGEKAGIKIGKEQNQNEIKKVLGIEPARKYSLNEV